MKLEDMAREAAETCGKRAEYNCDRAWLERFAALIRAQALNEAAKHCDNTADDYRAAARTAELYQAARFAAYATALTDASEAISALKEST